MLDWHAACSASGTATAVVHPTGDLSSYRLLIAPSLYLVTQASADNLAAWLRGGGVLVLNYFSAVADERDRIHPGGAPGPLRELIGATVGEWWPLQEGDEVQVCLDGLAGTNSSAVEAVAGQNPCIGTVFTEALSLHGAELVGTYVTGGLAGGPAVLRNRVGNGIVYYVSSRLDLAGTAAILHAAREEAGALPLVPALPDGVEAVRRGDGDDVLLFVLNHTENDVTVPLFGPMTDLLDGAAVLADTVSLSGYGVAMLR